MDDVVLDIVAGEDWSTQLIWTDEDGNPMPITDPVTMDVKDSRGQVAIHLTTGVGSPLTSASIGTVQAAGFAQLTIPRVLTATLTPGDYRFDLFAGVVSNGIPFSVQVQRVVVGTVRVAPRTTIQQ